jgi:hypothetical protein
MIDLFISLNSTTRKSWLSWQRWKEDYSIGIWVDWFFDVWITEYDDLKSRFSLLFLKLLLTKNNF